MIKDDDYVPTIQRDKQTWIQLLRGGDGVEQQRTAREELMRHFSAAALLCLRTRRESTKQLDGWTNDEVVNYAGKVVDATMAELLSDDFQQFEGFDDARPFSVQAARLVIAHIAADLDHQ